MKQKKYIFSLSLLIAYSRIFYAAVEPITPGEAMYSIVTRIGAGVDEANSGLSSIENLFGSLSCSNIENVCSMLDPLVEQLTIGNSVAENIIVNLSVADSLVENLEETLGSSLDQVQSSVSVVCSNISQLITEVNTISAQDALIYDTVTQTDSKVDELLSSGGSPLTVSIYDTMTEIDSKVDTLLSSGGSPLTVSIYDTVTEIDTKIDTINTKINNLSAQNVLLYNLESVIDSKVDDIRSFPDFTQTPTGFQSTAINARTSRYFIQAVTKTIFGVGSGDIYAMSLFNSGTNNRIMRISAYGFNTNNGSASRFNYVIARAYKNSALTGTVFNSIPSSDMHVDTQASITSLGTLVHLITSDSVLTENSPTPNILNCFQYIPKELYSVIVAPGETVNFIPTGNYVSGSSYTFYVMWEEIINY